MMWEKVVAQGGAGAVHANGELQSEPALHGKKRISAKTRSEQV